MSNNHNIMKFLINIFEFFTKTTILNGSLINYIKTMLNF